MTDLQVEMAEIEVLQASADQGRAQTTAKITEASRRISALRERILAGETTGDRWRDFVLTRFHGFNLEAEDVYRKVEQTLVGKVGEFVLFLERKKVPTKHEFGRGASNYVPVEEISLAIIATENLSIEDGRCWLAVRKCAKTLGRGVSVTGENLDLSDYGSKRLRSFPHRLIGFVNGFVDDEPLPEQELVIGDEAVHAWFAKRTEPCLPLDKKALLLRFGAMAEMFGRPLDGERYPMVAEAKKRRQAEAKAAVLLAIGLASMLKVKESRRDRGEDFTHGERLQARAIEKFAPGEVEEFLQKSLREAVKIGLHHEQDLLIDLASLCRQYKIEIPA